MYFRSTCSDEKSLLIFFRHFCLIFDFVCRGFYSHYVFVCCCSSTQVREFRVCRWCNTNSQHKTVKFITKKEKHRLWHILLLLFQVVVVGLVVIWPYSIQAPDGWIKYYLVKFTYCFGTIWTAVCSMWMPVFIYMRPCMAIMRLLWNRPGARPVREFCKNKCQKNSLSNRKKFFISLFIALLQHTTLLRLNVAIEVNEKIGLKVIATVKKKQKNLDML